MIVHESGAKGIGRRVRQHTRVNVPPVTVSAAGGFGVVIHNRGPRLII